MSFMFIKWLSKDPLTFSENIRQSIELPISLSLRMANRALMFELLEKQHLMSIFGALSGLLLFQDGVFANSFCDRLFAHIETDYDKITRSLHRNENSKIYCSMNKTCIVWNRSNRKIAIKSIWMLQIWQKVLIEILER